MKFGFDVDDTLINLREHAFHIYNKRLKKNIPIEAFHQLKTLEIHHPFGLSDAEGSNLWKELMEEIYYSDCPAFPYALEMLNELETIGHEIYYVTSRPMEHCEQTKRWLVEAGFPVHDDRFYCGMKDSEKVKIIKELGVDYYFDDKPAVLETLSESGVHVYVRNNSYNQEISLPRINCWSELKSILQSD